MKKIAVIIMLALMLVGCGKQPSSDKRTYEKTEVKGNVKYRYLVTEGKKILASTTTYANGKKNGEEIHYGGVSNLYISSKTNWVNGKKEGMEYKYRKDGKIKFKANYINNELDGLVTMWNADGSVYTSGKYVNGKKEGTHKTYYSKGKLYHILHYINNVKKGKAIYYNENGAVQDRGIWIDDFNYKQTPTAAEKRKAAAEERERNKWIKENEKKRKATAATVSLSCTDSGVLSGSEMSSKIAIGKGKGEGAALGYMMNNGNPVSVSKNVATNYCITNVNYGSYDCVVARAYVNGCMSKFGH